MKRLNKLTQKLGEWFNKDSSEAESPLLLQSLEDRVLYSAVPLPVDNVDAPVENTDLDDVQFSEIESNTTLPIGDAIAETASSQLLSQTSHDTESTLALADATLEDLDELVNSLEESDEVSTENDEPRTAMGLATATPEPGGTNFFILQEGESFTIDYDFLGNPSANTFLPFGQGFFLTQAPASGEILVNGAPLEVNTQLVTPQEILAGEVVFVPEADFVGNIVFSIQGDSDVVAAVSDISVLYEGVADDGVNVFGDEFAPVDGSAPAFEATALKSESHVAALSDGEYVVVASLGDGAGQFQFQRFDSQGVATGTPVVVSPGEFNFDHIKVVGIEDGGFLIAFEAEDGSGQHFNVQRFDANDQPVIFNGTNLQLTPVAMSTADDISLEYLGQDRFVTSFIEPGTTNILTIVSSIDGQFEKSYVITPQSGIENLSVETALLADGGYVVARVESNGSANSIHASILDPGSHFQQQNVQLAVDNNGSDVSLVGTPDNGFAIVYQGSSADPAGIYVAKFDRLGNPVGSPTLVAVGTTTVNPTPDIVVLSDGSFVVSYTTDDADGTQEVLGQRLNADLTQLGSVFKINSFSANDQTNSEIALLSDGKLVATFESGDQTKPSTHFHQRFQMSTSGAENTWIPLQSVIGVNPTSSTEVFETLEIAGLPIGSKIHTNQYDLAGELMVDEIFFDGQSVFYNPADIGPLAFMAPADTSGTIEATATLATNDGSGIESFVTNFQVVVDPVIDTPIFSDSSYTTDEDTALTMTQWVIPSDLVNPISNVTFSETDFEDRLRSLPSPTSGIGSSYIFDGATPLTAELPAIGQAASFEFWIRSEDFAGNDRVIAQHGDESQGFSIIQRQDEIVLQFKSDSSEIIELSAAGLKGLQRTGSYDQVVVSFGTSAGDSNKLDAALFLNGELAESITDVSSAQFAEVVQTANILNLGSSGTSVGVGASTADNFGGELGLFRFEANTLDSDAVGERYNTINNAPRVISIEGQDLASTDTIYFQSNENNIVSSISVLPNGDLQFDPTSDFNKLANTDIETSTLDIVVQSGAEFFNTVTELNVVGRNDLPVQQFDEITINQNGGTQLISMNGFVVDPDDSTGSPSAPPTNMYLTTPVNGANIINDASGFHIELVPSQLAALDDLVLNISVMDPNTNEIATYDLTINLVDEFTISGVVANDWNIDGSIDGDWGFEGAEVHLYEADSGLLDLTDADYVATTTTDNSGRFIFDWALLDFDKDYFVVVDSLTVVDSPDDLNLVWAQQTFATEGAVFNGNSGLELTQDAGYLIGGKDSEITDMFFQSQVAQDAQHIIAVSSVGNLSPLNELGFGFNFDIVNVVDNSDQLRGFPGELDGQGTLNQFLHNANSVAGSNHMRFVPTTDANASNANGDQWWKIETESLLPTIRDDGTVVDGRVFTTSDNGLVGDYSYNPIPTGANGTIVGAPGDWIGEDDAFLSTIDAPELEITRRLFDDLGDALPELYFGIRVQGNSTNPDVEGVGIHNIAINGFGDASSPRVSGNILIDGTDSAGTALNVSSFTIANNVVGSDPFFTAMPVDQNETNNITVISVEGSNIVTDSVLGITESSNSIENNLVSYANRTGILLFNPDDLNVTQNLTVHGNQIISNGLAQESLGDGIGMFGNSSAIIIAENYIANNYSYGIDNVRNLGSNAYLRNTIENNGAQDGSTSPKSGGIRLTGSNNIVVGNSIVDNAGPGVHVTGQFLSASASTGMSYHNVILSNEFSGNEGISIDLSRPLDAGGDPDDHTAYDTSDFLIGDGVNVNDEILDGSTGNAGLDSPEILSAKYDGSKITVTFAPLMSTPYPEDRIQIYLTENGVTHGEGNVLLGEVSAASLVNLGGSLVAEFSPPSDRLPFDLTQEININATLTSFALVTRTDSGAPTVHPGYQTSEFGRSQVLEVSPPTPNTDYITTSVTEGQTVVLPLPATDDDGDALTYSIVNGRDGARFTIDNTGLLQFVSPPDFEAPNDSDADNDYEVLISAADDTGELTEIYVTVIVTDENEVPVFTNPATFDVTEGTLAVGQATTTDVDSGPATYSIKTGVGAADGALFTVDSATGDITFITAPDYENPNSVAGNNTYTLTVIADDQDGGTTEQAITVNVTDENEVPVFTNPATFDVTEGTLAVGQATTTDVDSGPATYSIKTGVGAADGALFTVDSATGDITFITAPDYENPNSVAGNNTYTLTVIADDQDGGTTEQVIAVNVTDENEVPVFTNPATFDVTEGTLAVGQATTTDVDSGPATYSIKTGTGVADGALFTVDSATGDITFITAPDYENPNSVAGNNTYTLTVIADDQDGGTTEQVITVNVTDENEVPVFTNPATFDVTEGTLVVGQATTTDVDSGPATYSIKTGTGAADGALFTVDCATGDITFIAAPDYENPNSVAGNNTYTLTVIADDQDGGTTEQVIAVNVTDENEVPVFTNPATFDVTEGTLVVGQATTTDVDSGPATYSIKTGTGAADGALFTVDSATGDITFITAPDYENPNSVAGNNTYTLTVIADDQDGGTTEQVITVNVTDENEVPVFTNPATFDVTEGTLAVGQATTTDVDSGPATYSIKTGAGAADGALFTVDSATGDITFITAPDYENPNSVAGNNTYTLTIIAYDQDGGTTEQALTVNVTDENEVPVFTNSATFDVTEGTMAVGQATTTDVDSGPATYSIKTGTGAADGALFTVDSATGDITFITAPDYENPNSVAGNNTYTLTVIADDQDGGTTEQVITVNVTNDNELPILNLNPVTLVNEGETFVQTATATDPENDDITFSIDQNTGDGSLFEIDSSGNISFLTPPDFENPGSSSNTNTYALTVMANNGNGGTATQEIEVTVIDFNEAPVFIGNDQQLLLQQDESSTATFDLVELFADPENESLTLEIVGGADAELFHIVNNELALIEPPELAGPQSPTYEVEILTNDGDNNSDTQTVELRVNNINDAPEADDYSYPGSQNELDADASFGVPNDDRYDADGDSTHLVFAGNGPDNGLFEIVDDRIQFINPPVLTNGIPRTYTVTTALSDGIDNSDIITFEITVGDVNQRPEILTAVPVSGVEVDDFENNASVNLVDVVTFDADGDAVTLRLAGGGTDNDLFEIVNNEIQFRETPTLSGGETRTYNVSIVANDGELDSLAENITLSVTNINNAPDITYITPVATINLSQTETTAVANLNSLGVVSTYDKDGDPVEVNLNGSSLDNELFEIDNQGNLRFKAEPQLQGLAQKDFNVNVLATDELSNSASETITIRVNNDSGVSIVDSENNDNAPTNTEPQLPNAEGTISEPELDTPAESTGPTPISTAKPAEPETANQQPVTQRKSDINGNTAVSDLKTGDEDTFFDFDSDAVSYISQSDTHGPQLLTSDIGEIIENRRTVEEVQLKESMLANYFWQGFEDSEDEFIRRNLKVDNTTIVAASAGLSLGIVSYLRLAAMATTVVTQLPAWKTLDVSPLIREFDEEEAETIHQIVDE